MEYFGRDRQESSLLSPSNEADSGYEPSPSSTSGPCTMFSFETQEYSDPEDSIPSYEITSASLSEDDDDEDEVVPSMSGRPSSSPIPIPFPGQYVFLSRSTPVFGYSVNTPSPLRRLSCPQFLLQPSVVRVVRHVATQTRTSTECLPQENNRSPTTAANEHLLAPMRGPLPDVVQHNGRRLGHVERARSASVSLPVGNHIATGVGQALQRLSDDFERRRRPSFLTLFLNSNRRSRSYSQSDT